jgi:hypothetical protein
VLAGGVVLVFIVSSSAMVALECRDGMGCVTGGGGVFWGVSSSGSPDAAEVFLSW